jgi:hypothetical protein
MNRHPYITKHHHPPPTQHPPPLTAPPPSTFFEPPRTTRRVHRPRVSSTLTAHHHHRWLVCGFPLPHDHDGSTLNRSLPAQRASARTSCVIRVTSAPAPSYVVHAALPQGRQKCRLREMAPSLGRARDSPGTPSERSSSGASDVTPTFWDSLNQFSDELAERYTFDFQPEYRAKIRKQCVIPSPPSPHLSLSQALVASNPLPFPHAGSSC